MTLIGVHSCPPAPFRPTSTGPERTPQPARCRGLPQPSVQVRNRLSRHQYRWLGFQDLRTGPTSTSPARYLDLNGWDRTAYELDELDEHDELELDEQDEDEPDEHDEELDEHEDEPDAQDEELDDPDDQS